MPAVKHVKKAQQRYQMVPVLGEDGQPVRVPVMDGRTGEQKVSKRRGPVFMTKTVADKSQPLPMPKCDYPNCQVTPDRTIEVGTPYKHLTVKTGSYSSRTYTRHEQCPTWQVWEYRDNWSSRVARAQHAMHQEIDAWNDYEDFDSIRDSLASQASELLEEKQEALDAMPEGLAEGSESQEQYDALETWVSEIENVSEPEEPEVDESGLDGAEPSEEEIERYLEEARDALSEAVDSCEL